MAHQSAASDATLEEIRFAVVLNGGVSLAVWIGGAVLEIDRLTRGDGVYQTLLSLVGNKARADVIAGTSAGGINGAALALAQINQDADLRRLRDMWAIQGDIDALLEEPFRGSPVSLLRGDEYFLPELGKAFDRLVWPYRPRSAEERPVDLTITTTLLHGAPVEVVDALGQTLPQIRHDGRFTFRHDTADSAPPGRGPSPDFDVDHIGDTVKRLALAARCTASFPMAFEPSFVPVQAGEAAPADGAVCRPDMGRAASWWKDDAADRSRFTVDGGLLANTPTREALDAVDRMPVENATRRVMLLVYPHATAEVSDTADRPDDMPTLLASSFGLMEALSSQGSRTFVDEIDRHNRAAASRRASRMDLLRGLQTQTPSTPLVENLYATADQLSPHYRLLRIRRAARDLAARVPAHAGWSYERIRTCAESAQFERNGLPYVPADGPPQAAVDAARDHTGWAWGITTAEHLAESAHDLLARLVWVVSDVDACHRLAVARRDLSGIRATLRALRDQLDSPWENEPELTRRDPGESYWSLRLDAYQYAMRPGPIGLPPEVAKVLNPPLVIGEHVRKQVGRIVTIVADAVPTLDGLRPDQITLGDLEGWRALLNSPPSPAENLAGIHEDDHHTHVAGRLLALEILTTCLAEESQTGTNRPVELFQISLQARNPFATYSLAPRDKSAGMMLSRFAGFLKQSWRINDWTWGRLDTASTLCRIVLDPARLRRMAVLRGDLGVRPAVQLAAETVQTVIDSFPRPPTDVRITRLIAAAQKELEPVYEERPDGGLPASLPNLADLAAWSVQTAIAIEEVPALALAVKADHTDGGNPRSRGQHFLTANAHLLEQLDDAQAPHLDPLDLGVKALGAFDRAGIGREPLGEELMSDHLIRTTVEIASVAVTVLDSPRSGLAVVRPVTRALRGAALLPYWTVRGITSGSTIARFLALLSLSFGGLLVVLALLGTLPSWASGPAAAAGGAALMATFAYGALRTGTFLHGLVLLSPVIPLVVYAVTATGEEGTGAARGASVVVLVGLSAAALIVLGSLPAAPPSPARVWKLHRTRILVVLGGIAALAAAVLSTILWVAPALVAGAGMLSRAGRITWILAIAAGVVVIGIMSFVAWRRGSWLRTWVLQDTTWLSVPTSHAAGSAAGWSIVYGMIYLVAAIGLALVPSRTLWLQAALGTATAFALALLLFVPWYVPWVACRREAKELVAEATTQIYGTVEEDLDAALIQRLQYTGRTYHYFLTCDRNVPTLTRAGNRLSSKIGEALSSRRPITSTTP